MNTESERHRHPAFAQISFTRTQCGGGGMPFYGSELKQNNYIVLTIKQSEMERTLTDDRYFAHNHLIRLRMSSGQFSELITNMNVGDGPPCTLEYVDSKKVEELPGIESRKEFVRRKFEDRMKEFAITLKTKQNRVKELSAKKTLSKEDQRELNMLVDWLTNEVASNIPFFAKCFQETMDEVVFEAKTEVENAIQHKINVLGLEELQKQNKLLTNDTLPDRS